MEIDEMIELIRRSISSGKARELEKKIKESDPNSFLLGPSVTLLFSAMRGAMMQEFAYKLLQNLKNSAPRNYKAIIEGLK